MTDSGRPHAKAHLRLRRAPCTVTSDDCDGQTDYLVYLGGLCAGSECVGHPACEEHAQAFRRGERPVVAERITSIPSGRLHG